MHICDIDLKMAWSIYKVQNNWKLPFHLEDFGT